MMKRERTSDEKRFETSNLPIAASLLISVPGITLANISATPSVDGRRIITLRYPVDQEATVQRIVENFHLRRLVVPLYTYNRALNALRDCLHQRDSIHAALS